jgi:threonine dehydrogenase-like Zn-dependent dehydrogenase
MRATLDATIDGGTIVWVGVAHPDLEISVKPFDIYRREITIRGTYTNPFTMERAIALLASEQIRWEDVVTHRFPLAQFDEAWKIHQAGAGLKVCIKP